MRNHALDILVSTTVIEVGIDIPSANMMVIEQADRFGLAQLHQLRGRVGRAGQKAYCLLFPTPPEILEKESLFEEDEQMIHERLKAMEKYHSGNELAELDLKQRGIGNPFGDKQSGWGHFRFASLFDTALLEECKSALAITALGE
jgi:ATP-dependent DNA helicase RecG